MRFMAIDPGVHDFSVAVIEDDRLVFASFEVGGAETLDLRLTYWEPSRVVIERPQAYQLAGQKGDQQDILDLSWSAGELAAACRLHKCSPLIITKFPKDWKGQITKEVTRARVYAELSDAEKVAIVWPAARLKHNVYDAIHLGLRTWTKRKV